MEISGNMHHTHSTICSRNMDTTKAEVENIQKILDNTLKRILQTPTSTPSEIIQIETGIWDIEAMIEEKQIMYYPRIHNNPTAITKTTASEPKTPWNTTIKKYTQKIQSGT